MSMLFPVLHLTHCGDHSTWLVGTLICVVALGLVWFLVRTFNAMWRTFGIKSSLFRQRTDSSDARRRTGQLSGTFTLIGTGVVGELPVVPKRRVNESVTAVIQSAKNPHRSLA